MSTYISNDDFYDDITQIIARVSNRTLELKTKNAELLNKITLEVNDIISKTRDIVKTCLNERSGNLNAI